MIHHLKMEVTTMICTVYHWWKAPLTHNTHCGWERKIDTGCHALFVGVLAEEQFKSRPEDESILQAMPTGIPPSTVFQLPALLIRSAKHDTRRQPKGYMSGCHNVPWD